MSHTPTDTPRYEIPIVQFLNALVRNVAEFAAWFNVILIATIVLQVVLRYGFNNGQVMLEELMWHFYAVAFMFGMAYAMVNDSHIRVDLIHMALPRRVQHVIEILGILLLLFPVLWVLFDHSIEWVMDSYRVGESSSSPTGLGNRWIIKSVIPTTCVLLAIAAFSRLIQEVLLLWHHGKEPEQELPGNVTMIRKFFHLKKCSLEEMED